MSVSVTFFILYLISFTTLFIYLKWHKSSPLDTPIAYSSTGFSLFCYLGILTWLVMSVLFAIKNFFMFIAVVAVYVSVGRYILVPVVEFLLGLPIAFFMYLTDQIASKRKE